MEKRYQVFVSSTYDDLEKERQEVMRALLELDCIPAGMELFPASDDDQWSLIKKVIQESDYYIVIIGGRYGSIGPDGFSYTEMEYRYAVECGKPVSAFLHKRPDSIPSGKTEKDSDGIKRLNEFRAFAQAKMCRFWETPADLGAVVSRSLTQLIKSHPATGWVKADQVPSKSSVEEILRLRKMVEDLEAELERVKMEPPKGVGDLAQGEEEYEVNFSFSAQNSSELLDFYSEELHASSFSASWNDLFAAVAPILIAEAPEGEMKNALDHFAYDRNYLNLAEDFSERGKKIYSFSILDRDFQTIKVQFRALGLIAKSEKQRSVKDREIYWSLTPRGDLMLTQLRAIKRQQKAASSSTALE